MSCPCDLPMSGSRDYQCQHLGTGMNPHWCMLYRTRLDYRRAWNQNRGPGQIYSNGNRPKSKTTGKPHKRRKPCGHNKLPPYSSEDAKFALSLCIRCEHYDDDSDHCQAVTTCKRVAQQLSRPCSERVKLAGHGCPLMRW